MSLATPITTRDGTLTKDSRSVNVIFDEDGGLLKRPGLTFATQVIVSPPVSSAQGIYSNGKIICVINNIAYVIIPDTYLLRTPSGGSITVGPYLKNCYFVSVPSTPNVLFHNGWGIYLVNLGTVGNPTYLTVSGFPTTNLLVPGLVYLDGYYIVGDSQTNYLYNSNLSAPGTWTSTHIVFSQTDDNLVGIGKHLNYLVAFGSQSAQFFYDSGNGVDGSASPLLPAQSYTMEIGCANGDSIVSTENTVFWVSLTQTHGRSIHLLDGVSPVRISTEDIDKILDGDDLSRVTAYSYKFYGHTLYILTLHHSNITLIYDMQTREWTQWTQFAPAASDQPNPGVYTESYFRPSFYTFAGTKAYVLDDDTGTLYYFDQSKYQDNNQPIYCRVVTKITDHGSTHRKFYGRMEVVGDKVSGGIMLVRHSGDDYQTWSNYRSVDLSASRSQIYLGGADRRRAWEFLSSSNVPLRLQFAELDYRLGEVDQEQNIGRSK
jgi:hypothetical protein